LATLTGKEIGKYRIEKRIGRGGMAEVYQGVHTNLDRKVAIKVLHGYLAEGGDFIARFKREAKAVANLRHPNIVQVHDFDVQDEIIFMVMEYIEGTNLQQRLVNLDKKGERLSITQIGSIINDIAGALDYAHSKGMLHRDVKPSNILLDSNDKAYLTDFGIAKILSDQNFTATGTLIGTPAYMSPEQGMGEELSKESDIYSLGVVAFEMITGQVPYDAQTPIAIVQKQISDPIPHINELVKNVPDQAQDVIDIALAKAPGSRYSSAEALVIALRTALHALEAVDPSLKATAASASKVDRDELISPTVEMQDLSTPQEVDQPTVLMEEGGQPEIVEDPGLVEESSPDMNEAPRLERGADEKKTSFFSSTRNRILIGVGGIVLVAAVVIGVQSLGNTPASQDSAPPTEPAEQTAPQAGMSGEEYFEEAQSMMGQDQWTNAIENLDLALSAGFENADVYGLRAYAKLNLGNKIPAIDDFTRALELNETIYEYWRDRGITFFELGNLPAAIEDLNRALGINTDDSNGYRYRARVHSELDGGVEAIDDALRAASLEPDNFENYLLFYEIYLRHNFPPPEKAEEVMEMLDIAIDLEPTNPEIRILRGEIFWFVWDDEFNALNEYNLAVEHGHPGWVVPFDRRGLFYYEIGRCDLAVKDFTQYISMDSENPYIYQLRGECYVQLGDIDLTRADFTEFMIRSTGVPELADRRASVQSWLEANPE
jgi:serine/threonine protein kinase/tetratricopeptide (TPR) repeat protein